ncbi:hypothetical protein EAT1b_1252 [Exiguobacterium sp. AT1b]|uniref:Uncharacterized protein n=1 Tax=Exiguobacterium sp. (strain ATCC BAA-1283 / AT1b) TaxID=360911 RepID=C4KYL6_EXISA|nr:hypothetical protein EAT1b_1252 [Exiguobacterium sp. AT1b]
MTDLFAIALLIGLVASMNVMIRSIDRMHWNEQG